MKPILFNTEMIRAILDGRKTVTRRVVKEPYYIDDEEASRVSGLAIHRGTNMTHGMPYPDSPYRPGNILYVRETWQFLPCIDCPEQFSSCDRQPIEYENSNMVAEGCYIYKADCLDPSRVCWRPSIHMPREAARIFMRVTGVRVERLQDIMQSPPDPDNQIVKEGLRYGCDFIAVWNSTIKPADRALYGWDANPWVWVIEFERISKKEAYAHNAF